MAILAGNNFNVKDFAPALWLDAADSNTLYDAVSGGALVAAGGTVARWEDKSGNGRHATQSILANRPLRTVGAQNTRDVLRFDGTNDTMTCPALPTSATDFSVVIVGRHAAKTWTGNFNTELQAYIEMPHLITRGWVLQTRPDQGANRFQFCAFPTSGSIGIIRDVLPNQYNVLVGTRIQNGADSFSVNGVNQTNSNTTAWVFQNSPLNIGSWNGQRFLQGDILEIMIFSYVLSTAQRQSIERYLANKWGLGFNPLSLSPALWLDASDSNTLYDATTGGALVGAGGAVARWEDKSGNARHATQATLANRPLRTAAAQGGKDALTFDGVNDFMATPAFGGTQDCTYFLVAASKNATQLKVFAAHANNYENPPLGANFVAVNTARLETGQNGASGITKFTSKLAASQNLQNNIFRIAGVQFTSTNAGHIQRVNGATHTTTNAYPQDPGVFTKAAQSFGVGAYNGGSYQCHCDIAELIYFTKLLTASERQAVERYLAQKWNIIT